ncbi:MAG: hypothetical protein AB1898_32390 [Acidobacteriota bacterium]
MVDALLRSSLAAAGAIEVILYLVGVPPAGLHVMGTPVWNLRLLVGVLLLIASFQNWSRGFLAKFVYLSSLASVLLVYVAWFRLSRESLKTWSEKYRFFEGFVEVQGSFAGYLNKASWWDLIVLAVSIMALTIKLVALLSATNRNRVSAQNLKGGQ